MCSKMFKIGVAILILGHLQNGNVRAYEIQLKDLLKMQQGLGRPHTLTVVVGHDALMKLTKTVDNQQACEITTPSGQTFNLASPPSDRYQVWDSKCGLRVRHVQMSDYGRWRLSSNSARQSYTGWIEIYVEEDTSSYEAAPISLVDGEQHTSLDLSSLDNSYCLVTQPFAQSTLVAGHCQVKLDKATRAVQGNWNIVMGLPGKVTELHADRQIIVGAERLDVGYIHDRNTNKIHLYCNIVQTMKNVTFCRFQKTTKTGGYNIMEGLSDGLRSYYGDGFVAKHCGITIETPTDHDFGTWRCSVGSQLRVGTELVQQTPMQALINVPHHYATGTRVERDLSGDDENEVRTLFVQENLSFTILCSSDYSLSYCWFLHPNGTQFSPLALTTEEQLFWYSGESLQTGDCGITFAQAHLEDAGDWYCHIGATSQRGLELTDRINVRVTGPLAANRKEIDVTIGERNATIYCHTANGNRPLDYCRFLTPTFVGINMDDSVNRQNAILERYYFTPDRYLNRGDCSLTITAVREEDIGVWTCAAVINTNTEESSDTVTLVLVADNSAPLSRAGIVGMATGVAFLLVVLVGALWFRKSKPSLWRRRNERPPSQQNVDTFDMVSFGTNSSDSGSVYTVGDNASRVVMPEARSDPLAQDREQGAFRPRTPLGVAASQLQQS